MSFLNILPFFCILYNVLSSTNFTTTSIIDNIGTQLPTATTISPSLKPTKIPTISPSFNPTFAIPDGKITLINIQTIICGITIDTFNMEKDAFISIYSNIYGVCSNTDNICQFDDTVSEASTTACAIAPPGRRRLQISGIDIKFKIGLANTDDVETVLSSEISTNIALTNAITAAFPGTLVPVISITDITIVEKENEFIIDKVTFGEKIFTKYLFIGITILFIGILWLILLTLKVDNNQYHRLNNIEYDTTQNISNQKNKPMATQIEMQEQKVEETKQDTNNNNNNTTKTDGAMPETGATPGNNDKLKVVNNNDGDDERIIDQQTMDELEDAWNSADDGGN